MANTGDVYGGSLWEQLQAQMLQWAAQARLQQQELSGYMGAEGTQPTRQQALKAIYDASPDLQSKYAADKSKSKGDWFNWIEQFLTRQGAKEILSDPVAYARSRNLLPAAGTQQGPPTLQREQMMKQDELARWQMDQQTKLSEWDRLTQIGWSREELQAKLGYSREELDKNLAWSREEQANLLKFQREELGATTGQNLLNTFAQLRGPENYFQYWNTQRAAQGSPNLAWAQALVGNNPLPAFQQGGPYQAATLGGLVNQTPSGVAAPAGAPVQQGGVAGTGYNAQQAYDAYLQQRPQTPIANQPPAQANSWYDQLLATQINPQKIGQRTWQSMAPSEQAGTRSLIEAQGGNPDDWANAMQKSWMKGAPTTQRTSYRW